MVCMVRQHRNGLTDESFDTHQIACFSRLAEGKGLALSASSRSPANSVNIGFWFVGQIVVEDVRDAVHVDATAGDVGGHKDRDLA